VLPYFRKLEHDLDFSGELHGNDGPIPIRRTPRAQWPALSQSIAEYAQERQIPYIADMNGDFRDGYCSVPIANRTHRASAAICYLGGEVRRRTNLMVESRASVRRILFDGSAAVGVETVINGEPHTRHGREIILCAGAIRSPGLLMLSGIGPAAALRSLGLAVIANLPGVGRNLQNHAILHIGAHLVPPARQASELRSHATSCFRYSSGHPDGAPGDLYMNIHSKSSWSALGRQIANISPILLRPNSRGTVTLASPDPATMPVIEFNLLSERSDLERLADAVVRVVDILNHHRTKALLRSAFPIHMTDRLRRLNQKTARNTYAASIVAGLLDAFPALSPFVLGRLTSSPHSLGTLATDRRLLEEHVRENVGGMFHPVGTCRMGAAEDPDAVVTRDGRVRGVRNLRVVDASVMPLIPRGNTNIPTTMVAERMADLILAAPL
jgi:5-(hydroxymethyl)furfural/furfural oxidase